MHIAIVGSRDYPDLIAVYRYLATLPDDTVLISGGARGVDTVAEIFAKNRGLEIIVYKPDWKRYGKQAGFLRNRQIIEHAELVVAFWDGVSRGTAHSIRIAQDMGKRVIVNPHIKRED